MLRFLLTLFLGKKSQTFLSKNKENIKSISQSSPLAASLVEKTFKLLLFWRLLVIIWYGILILLGIGIIGFIIYLVTKLI